MSEERKKILQMVESGRIGAQEGAQLLDLVSDTEQSSNGGSPVGEPLALETDTSLAQLPDKHRYWLYPFWGGALLMVLGGAVASSLRPARWGGAWAWLCGWILLLIGLLVLTLAAWVRNAHWIHLRVKDKGSRVWLSFPLPLRFTAMFLRLLRQFVQALRHKRGRGHSGTE